VLTVMLQVVRFPIHGLVFVYSTLAEGGFAFVYKVHNPKASSSMCWLRLLQGKEGPLRTNMRCQESDMPRYRNSTNMAVYACTCCTVASR
jgi:hypothetical protein